MPEPAIAYPIPMEPFPLQGVVSADRPFCAMLSAFAVHTAGGQVRGVWKDLHYDEVAKGFSDYFIEHQFPWERARRIADGILAVRLEGDIRACANGMTADEYQLSCVRHLTPAGGLIGMAPGLGKTLTAAIAARKYRSLIQGTRCWIVAPLNAVGVWERWRAFLKEYYDDVQILSQDSLHKLEGTSRMGGGLLIVDEVHGFRRMEADRTRKLHSLRQCFDVGIGLTGTVLHGGIEGTLSMLDACIPGSAWFASRWKAGEYFKCLVRKQIGDRTATDLVRPTGVEKDKFLDYLSTYASMLSSRSAVVRAAIQIPEQEITTVTLNEPWQPLDKEAADYALATLNSTGTLPNAQETAHALCRAGIDAKLGWLYSVWDDPEIPIVLFAHYTESLDAAERWLNDNRIAFVRVDGSVIGKERIECVQRFQAGEVPVFLGQIGAAGVAVDLFRAHISAALDHSWKATEYAQALARTCRRGQTDHCYHFDLACNPLQTQVIKRLQAAEDFNSEAIEYQEIKNTLALVSQSPELQSISSPARGSPGPS